MAGRLKSKQARNAVAGMNALVAASDILGVNRASIIAFIRNMLTQNG